jgi:soluble lytic murein transglycosylase
MFRALLLAALLAASPALVPQATAQDPARNAARQALAALQAGRFGEAQALAQQADPLLQKMITWQRLTQRGGAATAAEIVGFMESSPDWPSQDALQRRAEELFLNDPDDALALRFFGPRPARTIDGAIRHVRALLNANRRAEAQAAARRAWAADTAGDPVDEPQFLALAGNLLTADDHWRRFDRLSFARDFEGARRVLPFLANDRRASGELRLAYAADGAASDANPQLAARDAGATLERARMLRRRDADIEAAAAWAAGAAAQQGIDPAAQRAIWTERQILARKLLRLGDARTAYQVAAQHGQAVAGEPRQEAEFLAGFIALRMLNDARLAQPHFNRMAEGSRSAITQARALYWQGRTAEAMGDAATARARYTAAAAFPVTFYGQMGMLALGEDGAQISARIRATPVPRPSEAEARAFLGRELPRLVMALSEIGEARRARPFLLRLEEVASSQADRLLVARLATATGRLDNAVWVARRGGVSGAMLIEDGWPVPYIAPESGVEPAIVYAITRQESNFEPEAVSSANARGLMQLLPATAQGVARRLGIPHNVNWLISDPQHNMRLGAAYIEQRLGDLGGVMPFAFAAYNAGIGRVNEWLQTYGDPRTGRPQMLDWMELIPFGETRNYVQRVIENVAVYRARDPRFANRPHPMSQWARQ